MYNRRSSLNTLCFNYSITSDDNDVDKATYCFLYQWRQIPHDNASSVGNHDPWPKLIYVLTTIQFCNVHFISNLYQYAFIEEFITFTCNSASCARWHWILYKYEIEDAYCLSRGENGLYTTLTWCEQTNKIFSFFIDCLLMTLKLIYFIMVLDCLLGVNNFSFSWFITL